MSGRPAEPGRHGRRRWGAIIATGLVLGLIVAVTVADRVLGPSPRPPLARPMTEPPLAASSCVIEGGVAIGPGDDGQSVVDRHPSDTAYVVKAGVHLRN